MSSRHVMGALICVFAMGCARSAATSAASDQEPVQLHVANRHWLDVVVYVAAGGQTRRLGTVTATRNATLSVPASLLGTAAMIRFIADPVGSQVRHTSDAISVHGGQRIEWTLEVRLASSSIRIHE